jgi:hypothetical protein
MVDLKVVLTAMIVLILLAVGLFSAFSFHVISFDTLNSFSCGFSNYYACYWQYSECCGNFVNWCTSCRENDWKISEKCPRLGESNPSWLTDCVAYSSRPSSGFWKFSGSIIGTEPFTVSDSDNNPKTYCSLVCIR